MLAPPKGPVADSIDPPEAGRHCRAMTSQALKMLLQMGEHAAVDGKITLDQLRRMAALLANGDGPLNAKFQKAESNCVATFELAAIERQRHDHLGRLITQCFKPLLDVGPDGIERRHLGQFFTAIRMMLGEDVHLDLKDKCVALAEGYRNADGLIDWEAFHRHPGAQEILEKVLVTIARTFRRFEPRRDWFLIMMNSQPSSISVSSNAFVPRRAEDKAGQFGERNMVKLFDALFASVHRSAFDDARRAGFVERWGVEPEKVFGQLFVDLQAMAGRLK